MELEKLNAAARTQALSSVLRSWDSEERTKEILALNSARSDESLDAEAKRAGVPEDQWPLHRAMVRNEPNAFVDDLRAVDGLLKPGDLILMTNPSSTKLVKGQQIRYYKQARSSHVALVHGDFVCIDAMPKAGATNRIISQLLAPAGDNWRVIRCDQISDPDAVMLACAFYLAQPYLIFPSKRSAPTYTYCSELARKVYAHCGVVNVGISDASVIAPAHFDMLADGVAGRPHWQEVTDSVRPAVEFCKKYSALVDISARLFIEGLLLNRQRFEERTVLLKKIKQHLHAGKISATKAAELRTHIREIESKMNYTFWDVPRSGGSAPKPRDAGDGPERASDQA